MALRAKNEPFKTTSFDFFWQVIVNFEIGYRNLASTKGLVDLHADSDDRSRTAEVQLQQLNIRLSYLDWLMIQAIVESFPVQARQGEILVLERLFKKKYLEFLKNFNSLLQPFPLSQRLMNYSMSLQPTLKLPLKNLSSWDLHQMIALRLWSNAKDAW